MNKINNVMLFNVQHTVYETPSKDLCINNNNVHTPNGNFYNQQQQHQHQQQQQSNVVGKLIENVAPIGPLRPKAQLIANAMTKQTHEDGNVLKKVISFTLEQMSNGDNNQTTNNICKISRPNFVPEKLRFSEYNQFEGEFTLLFDIHPTIQSFIIHLWQF